MHGNMFPDVDGRTCMAKVAGEFLQLSVATAHKNVSCIRTCCEHGNSARPFTWEKKSKQEISMGAFARIAKSDY